MIEALEAPRDDRRSRAAGDVQCFETLGRGALGLVGVGAGKREAGLVDTAAAYRVVRPEAEGFLECGDGFVRPELEPAACFVGQDVWRGGGVAAQLAVGGVGTIKEPLGVGDAPFAGGRVAGERVSVCTPQGADRAQVRADAA